MSALTGHQWPSREEWQADAEHAERTRCFPSERVSSRLGDYASDEERAGLADRAKRARSALYQIAKAAQDPDSTVDGSEWRHVRWVMRQLDELEDRHGRAAEEATEKAVAEEISRRDTDTAWQKELARRAAIEHYLADPLARFGEPS
jgi:hypothetical protein